MTPGAFQLSSMSCVISPRMLNVSRRTHWLRASSNSCPVWMSYKVKMVTLAHCKAERGRSTHVLSHDTSVKEGDWCKKAERFSHTSMSQGGILQWAEGVAPANGHTVATDSSPANSVVRWCADSITGNLTVVVWIGTSEFAGCLQRAVGDESAEVTPKGCTAGPAGAHGDIEIGEIYGRSGAPRRGLDMSAIFCGKASRRRRRNFPPTMSGAEMGRCAVPPRWRAKWGFGSVTSAAESGNENSPTAENCFGNVLLLELEVVV